MTDLWFYTAKGWRCSYCVSFCVYITLFLALLWSSWPGRPNNKWCISRSFGLKLQTIFPKNSYTIQCWNPPLVLTFLFLSNSHLHCHYADRERGNCYFCKPDAISTVVIQLYTTRNDQQANISWIHVYHHLLCFPAFLLPKPWSNFCLIQHIDFSIHYT